MFHYSVPDSNISSEQALHHGPGQRGRRGWGGGGRGWPCCFLLGWCPCIVGNEAVMSYLALAAPGWLNIHGAQAANVHSALHLSVEQHYVFKEESVCACMCTSRYVIQGCGNSILPETRPHPPPHKITAQVFNYWSLIRQMDFKLITYCSSDTHWSDRDGTELYFRFSYISCRSRLITDQYSQDIVITVSSCVILNTLKVFMKWRMK